MRLMGWIMMDCKESSPLISESLDHPLPLIRRLRLSMHLALCKACKFYLEQLQIIRILARRLGNVDTRVNEKLELNPEFKKKLKNSIKSA